MNTKKLNIHTDIILICITGMNIKSPKYILWFDSSILNMKAYSLFRRDLKEEVQLFNNVPANSSLLD